MKYNNRGRDTCPSRSSLASPCRAVCTRQPGRPPSSLATASASRAKPGSRAPGAGAREIDLLSRSGDVQVQPHLSRAPQAFQAHPLAAAAERQDQAGVLRTRR
jgi:hypothetical protein